jgi:hypothetical protein
MRIWQPGRKATMASVGGPLLISRSGADVTIEPDAPAELRTLQLTKQMAQAIELGERLVTFGDRRIAFGAHRLQQRMQRFDVGGNLGCGLTHARDRIRFVCCCESAMTRTDSQTRVLTTLRSVVQHRAGAAATNPFRRGAQ